MVKNMWAECVVVLVVLNLWCNGARAAPQVPCYFIFGDSLVDNGNNNQLQSIARADYLPYGIDFGGPTGRFSNGKTTVDVVAELLGFDDYIPPYATARGQNILKGVNFASAAAGIREETGRQLGGRITFSGQVRNYQNTVSQVVNILGDEDQAANYLSKCIYSVGLGSNDYLNNYFMPQFYSTSNQFTPEEYADSLIHDYSQQLRQSASVVEKPQVPCFFIFGDSMADNGNNNLLPTFAKVNYKPYGIDFPKGATGRFCNGRTTVDVLAELLGFENYIPPFAFANGSDILKGVNYASGAAGIRKESGKQLGASISMGRQLKNHRITISRIIDLLGKKILAKKHLNKCLYSVGMGSNDYINNYFMPQYYHTSEEYTTEEYAEVLITQYTRQILRLYKYGARKVALVGLGLIGCTPDAITTYGTNGSTCVDKLNNAAQLFNQKLVSLVDDLNTNLTDAKFIYVNSYEMGSGDPTSVGFKVTDVGCCPVDKYGQCTPAQTPCQNRSEYVFWDSFHPTEASNLITASRTYTAYNSSDTYPMDISHLVQLQLEPELNDT